MSDTIVSCYHCPCWVAKEEQKKMFRKVPYTPALRGEVKVQNQILYCQELSYKTEAGPYAQKDL